MGPCGLGGGAVSVQTGGRLLLAVPAWAVGLAGARLEENEAESPACGYSGQSKEIHLICAPTASPRYPGRSGARPPGVLRLELLSTRHLMSDRIETLTCCRVGTSGWEEGG